MPPLSNPKLEFVAQQLATGKSGEAAMLSAGYSPVTARHHASKYVSKSVVQARVSELLQEIASAKLVTASKLHARWSEMFEADINDIITETGSFKPIGEWPKIWRQMLSGVDVKELFERSKDGGNASWDKIGEVVKLKFVGVKDLGELLGRHKAIDAFVQTKQETHNHLHLHAELGERLNRGRLRAATPTVELLPASDDPQDTE